LIGAVLGSILVARAVAARQGQEQHLVESPIVAACCWAATLVAALVDLRRQFNAAIIGELGKWIRGIELMIYGGPSLGWESYIPGSDLWSSRLFPLLRSERTLMTWVLFAVMVYVFVPYRFREGSTARTLLRLGYWASFCILLFFGFHALYFHFSDPDYVAVLAVLMSVVIAFHTYFFRKARREAEGNEVGGPPHLELLRVGEAAPHVQSGNEGE
jgi:hypothetical protein